MAPRARDGRPLTRRIRTGMNARCRPYCPVGLGASGYGQAVGVVWAWCQHCGPRGRRSVPMHGRTGPDAGIQNAPGRIHLRAARRAPPGQDERHSQEDGDAEAEVRCPRTRQRRPAPGVLEVVGSDDGVEHAPQDDDEPQRHGQDEDDRGHWARSLPSRAASSARRGSRHWRCQPRSWRAARLPRRACSCPNVLASRVDPR